MSLSIWAILLLIAGLVLVLAEVFIPSGGVLGFLAAAALAGSIVMGFREGPGQGMIFLLVVAVAVPSLIGLGFHLLPRTPLGRRIILTGPTVEEVDPTTELDRQLRSLVGQVGRTITPLRPSGLTEFDGRRVDTLSEGMIIEAGSLVRVVDVQGRRVLVRKLDTEELPSLTEKQV